MDPYIRIYCESDFDFQYKLDSAHVNMPFKFIFFTTDINRNFECTFDGETYVHCTKVDNDSIVFHIDGNTFGLGNLRIRKEYFIDSASFDDNICNSVDVEKTNIYIIEEGSNANSVVYEGSTLPNFDAVLIGERAEQALIDIDEKETELDDILGEAQLWEDRIENIEISYVSHEQLDDTLASYVTNTNLDNTLNSYVTKTNLDNTLASYVTQESLSANAYLTQHQSLADYVTKNDLSEELTSYPTFNDISNMTYATQAYVQNKINEIPQPDLSAYVTKVELNNASYASKSYVQDKINAIPEVDLTGYATEAYVVNYVATYAPEPDLSNYPTYSYTDSHYVTYSYLDEVVEDLVIGQVDLHNYVKKDELNQASYATKSYVVDYVSTHAPQQDLSAYVTKAELNNAGYISSIPSEYITDSELNSCGYATQTYVQNKIDSIPTVDLTGYATESYVVNYVATYAPEPDLSAYVTKNELDNAGYLTSVPSEYITQAELSANAYLTQHQSLDAYVTKNELDNAGYLTSVPVEYITDSELSSCGYVTQTALSSNSYATQTYVSNTINMLIWQGTYTQYIGLVDYSAYQLYLIKQE